MGDHAELTCISRADTGSPDLMAKGHQKGAPTRHLGQTTLSGLWLPRGVSSAEQTRCCAGHHGSFRQLSWTAGLPASSSSHSPLLTIFLFIFAFNLGYFAVYLYNYA